MITSGILFNIRHHIRLVLVLLSVFTNIAASQKFNSSNIIFSNAVESYFEPIIVSEILGPHIPVNISLNYNLNAYRNAVVDLRRLKDLQLPDGRLDSYIFMLGECYRKLELPKLALKEYTELSDYFPNSNWRPHSLFRKTQISETLSNDSLIEVNYKLLKQDYPQHTLTLASGYLYGKSLIRSGKLDEAEKILAQISEKSEYYWASLFLRAYCHFQNTQWDKALLLLSKIYESAPDMELKEEARLLEGSIWVKKKDSKKALELFSLIDKQSRLFPLANLKSAQIYFSQKNYAMAQKLAKSVLTEEAYYFEASLVLMDSYWRQKDSLNANIIRNQLSQNTQFTRMLIVVEEEKTLLAQINKKAYSLLKYGSLDKNIPEFYKHVENKTRVLTKNLEHIQKTLKKFALVKQGIEVVGLSEKKLFDFYSQKLEDLDTNIISLKAALIKNPYEHSTKKTDSLQNLLSDLDEDKRKLQHLVNELYDLIDVLSYENKKLSLVQPKFIDVGLIMYQNLKKNYQESAKRYREYTNKLNELQQGSGPNE